MDFTRIKGVFKTGKINLYEIVKSYLLEEREKEDIKCLMLKLSNEEKKDLIAEFWDKIQPDLQKLIVEMTYSNSWEKILEDYKDLKEKEQIRSLEILGYLPNIKIADFLLQQMKDKKESIRLTATSSYKKMGPELTMEPMLKMLSSPKEMLPSRIFEVLSEMEKEIVPLLLQRVENMDIPAKQTIIQILGEIGDEECLSVFSRLIYSKEPLIRQRISEALKKMKLKKSYPLLIKLAEDEQWQTRMQAIETLGSLGMKDALGFLKIQKIKEKHPVVAECIDEAILSIEEADIKITINWVREGN